MMDVQQVKYLDWIDRLDSAVSEVFEMMLARGCSPTEECRSVELPISARILFSGAIHGECVLVASRSFAQITAEALLGSASAPDDPMVEDAVGELCNMIAGGWKSKLGSVEASCCISPPTISIQKPIEEQHPRNAGFCRFYSFDGNVFGVHMAF
jgi:chemotaxis protein CheX